MPEPVVIEPKVVSQPKVWSDAPIIEEYESDSDDDCFLAILIRDCNSQTRKEWLNKAGLPKRMSVLTRTGRIQVNTARASSTNNVNTARHNFNSQAVPTNATMKVNTVKPIVNNDYPQRALKNEGIDYDEVFAPVARIKAIRIFLAFASYMGFIVSRRDMRKAREEKERLAEEEATKAAFTNEYDFIQARINADKILAEKVQEEEKENFTIEERAKFLHDTIAAQRRFLA
ncbi:ribonuclease H-like domain-containing protein [Tanacetum coccineum]